MTDLSHYRVGPTKTSDDHDAVIYAIYPGQEWPIHGAYRDIDGIWNMYSANPYGFTFTPNNLPTTVARWLPPDGSLTMSDTEREGWTRVEVPVQPVRRAISMQGHYSDSWWAFDDASFRRSDTHRLTLPTDGGDLVCGDYRDGAGNVIKVERIND